MKCLVFFVNVSIRVNITKTALHFIYLVWFCFPEFSFHRNFQWAVLIHKGLLAVVVSFPHPPASHPYYMPELPEEERFWAFTSYSFSFWDLLWGKQWKINLKWVLTDWTHYAKRKHFYILNMLTQPFENCFNGLNKTLWRQHHNEGRANFSIVIYPFRQHNRVE